MKGGGIGRHSMNAEGERGDRRTWGKEAGTLDRSSEEVTRWDSMSDRTHSERLVR